MCVCVHRHVSTCLLVRVHVFNLPLAWDTHVQLSSYPSFAYTPLLWLVLDLFVGTDAGKIVTVMFVEDDVKETHPYSVGGH